MGCAHTSRKGCGATRPLVSAWFAPTRCISSSIICVSSARVAWHYEDGTMSISDDMFCRAPNKDMCQTRAAVCRGDDEINLVITRIIADCLRRRSEFDYAFCDNVLRF